MTKGKPFEGRFYMGGSAIALDQLRPMSELAEAVDAMTVEMEAVREGKPVLDPKKIYAHWNKRRT